MKSQQAQVATLCRKYLKTKDIPAKVTSKSFAGGNDVNIDVYNQSPGIIENLENEFAQYRQGDFNGMEDIYEYSNPHDDIPQVKYLFINNNFSDDFYQKAWTFLQNWAAGADQYPENYKDLPNNARVFGQWASQIVSRLLNGKLDKGSEIFWQKAQS